MIKNLEVVSGLQVYSPCPSNYMVSVVNFDGQVVMVFQTILSVKMPAPLLNFDGHWNIGIKWRRPLNGVTVNQWLYC